MNWEPSAGKLGTIRMYALQIERLAIAAYFSRKEGYHEDFTFEEVRKVLRATVEGLNRLSFSDDNIDCAIGSYPCDGLCLPDPCPRPPASGGGSSSSSQARSK